MSVARQVQWLAAFSLIKVNQKTVAGCAPSRLITTWWGAGETEPRQIAQILLHLFGH